MDTIAALERHDITLTENLRSNFKAKVFLSDKDSYGISTVINEKAVNRADLLGYIRRHRIDEKSGVLVINDSKHFYFDLDELRSTMTLISMKKLNLIFHLKSFIEVLCNNLPPMANFIGCFSPQTPEKSRGLLSPGLYRKISSYFEVNREMLINKDFVIDLFESHGFKIKDMTEINGLNYFIFQREAAICNAPHA